MPMRKTFMIWCGILLTLALAVRAQSQTQTGTLSGRITDQQGNVVPGATVEVINADTGAAVRTQTNADGLYVVPNLLPGSYRLIIRKQGFAEVVKSGLTLHVQDVIAQNFSLKVGSVAQSIQVAGTAPVLETQSSSVGQVVTERSIQNLPLNVRDPIALIALTGGVVLGPNFGSGGKEDVGRNFFLSDFNVGGGRSGSQEILIDGGPDTTGDVNRAAIEPPLDSISEFKVQVNTYNAEFGRTSGGVINMITRSGTNDYHGEAYDFERNSVFDANGYFNNADGLAKAVFQRHQFGFDAGGPILKNRLFAFGDYEGLRQGIPVTELVTLPTALERSGDFSQTLAQNGKLIQIFDPQTLTVLPSGARTRTAFNGNVIPSADFDPVALKVMSYIPLPNLPGAPITGQNNYISSSSESINSERFDVRVDGNLTQNTRLFSRISHQGDTRLSPLAYPGPAGGGRQTFDKYDQDVIGITRVLSPFMVFESEFSFTRAYAQQYGRSDGFNNSQLDFPQSFVQVTVPQFPVMNISDVMGTSNPPSNDAIVQSQPRNSFAWENNLNVVRGNHQLSFGSDFRILDFNEGQNSQPSGVFTFNRLFTQGPNPVQASANAGFGFADFLLGEPSSGSIQQLQPWSTRGLYYAFYAQDDWKATKRLTLNLGLRYSIPVGLREKYNRLAFLNLQALNPQGPEVGLPNLRGMLSFLGNGTEDTHDTLYHGLGPRFGFAFAVSQSTVIRGGYGILDIPDTIAGVSNGSVQTLATTQLVGTVNGVTPATHLSNPFPQGVIPAVTNGNPLASEGFSIEAASHSFADMYAQVWSLGVEHELPRNFVIKAEYLGNKGTHLFTGPFNVDQLPDQYLALGNALNNLVPNPFYGVIPSGPLSGSTISLEQSLLPYPQYTSVLQSNVPAGNSIYNAFQVSVEKRAVKGLTLLASYTDEKTITDVGSPLDVYNRRAERAIYSEDVPQQFLLSYVYALPFGRGRALGGNWGPLLNTVAGGWQWGGIATIQGGQPTAVSRSSINDGQSAHLSHPTIGEWFNTSVFSPAPPFSFGNVGPVLPDVRTDPTEDFDMSIQKDFSFAVRDKPMNLQFWTEFFNTFNRFQAGAPNGNVTSSAFGQVTSQGNSPRDIQFGLKLTF